MLVRLMRTTAAVLLLLAVSAPYARVFACSLGAHGHAQQASEAPSVTAMGGHAHDVSCHAVEGCLEGCIVAEVAPVLIPLGSTDVRDERVDHVSFAVAPAEDRTSVPVTPPPRS